MTTKITDNFWLTKEVDKLLEKHWVSEETRFNINPDIQTLETDIKTQIENIISLDTQTLSELIEKLPFPSVRYSASWEILNWNTKMEYLTWYTKEEILDYTKNWGNPMELFYWYDKKEFERVKFFLSMLKEWDWYEDREFDMMTKYDVIKYTFWNSYPTKDWWNIRLMIRQEYPEQKKDQENALVLKDQEINRLTELVKRLEREINNNDKQKQDEINDVKTSLLSASLWKDKLIDVLIEKLSFPAARYNSTGRVINWNSKIEEVTWYSFDFIQEWQDEWKTLSELFYSYDEKEFRWASNFIWALEEWQSYEASFKAKISNWEIRNFFWKSIGIKDWWSIRMIIDTID